MPNHAPVLNTHNHIIQLMRDHGFKNCDGGVCLGITMMAIQAHSIGELDVYKKRIEFLCGIDYQTLLQPLTAIKKPYALLSNEEKETREMAADALAYLEGIQSYQNLVHEYGNEYYKPIPLVYSKKLEKIGGFTSIKAWPGIYNDLELETYANNLFRVAKNFNSPFSTLLISDNHAISIHYDEKNNQFYLLDANHLPILEINNTHDMVNFIKTCFFEDSLYTPFESIVFLKNDLQNKHKKMQGLIETYFHDILLENFDESKINEVTGIKNCRSSTLAYIISKSTHITDIQQIENLKKSNFDLNTTSDLGFTPLRAAVDIGNIAFIKLLTDSNYILDTKDAQNKTALDYAKAYGRTEIETLLKQYKHIPEVWKQPDMPQVYMPIIQQTLVDLANICDFLPPVDENSPTNNKQPDINDDLDDLVLQVDPIDFEMILKELLSNTENPLQQTVDAPLSSTTQSNNNTNTDNNDVQKEPPTRKRKSMHNSVFSEQHPKNHTVQESPTKKRKGSV